MKFTLSITFDAPSLAWAESFGKKALKASLLRELIEAAEEVRGETVAVGSITLGAFRVTTEEKENGDNKDKSVGT